MSRICFLARPSFSSKASAVSHFSSVVSKEPLIQFPKDISLSLVTFSKPNNTPFGKIVNLGYNLNSTLHPLLLQTPQITLPFGRIKFEDQKGKKRLEIRFANIDIYKEMEQFFTLVNSLDDYIAERRFEIFPDVPPEPSLSFKPTVGYTGHTPLMKANFLRRKRKTAIFHQRQPVQAEEILHNALVCAIVEPSHVWLNGEGFWGVSWLVHQIRVDDFGVESEE